MGRGRFLRAVHGLERGGRIGVHFAFEQRLRERRAALRVRFAHCRLPVQLHGLQRIDLTVVDAKGPLAQLRSGEQLPSPGCARLLAPCRGERVRARNHVRARQKRLAARGDGLRVWLVCRHTGLARKSE